jgi:hypothetical protein
LIEQIISIESHSVNRVIQLTTRMSSCRSMMKLRVCSGSKPSNSMFQHNDLSFLWMRWMNRIIRWMTIDLTIEFIDRYWSYIRICWLMRYSNVQCFWELWIVSAITLTVRLKNCAKSENNRNVSQEQRK